MSLGRATADVEVTAQHRLPATIFSLWWEAIHTVGVLDSDLTVMPLNGQLVSVALRLSRPAVSVVAMIAFGRALPDRAPQEATRATLPRN
jgi:hypothetical protein